MTYNYPLTKHTGNSLVQEWAVSITDSAISLTTQAIPTGAVAARVHIIVGGNGGGSGRRGAAGTVRCGGGGAASNPALPPMTFQVGSATTWGLALGLPGSGGAAVTTDDTNGNNGSIPGTCSFTMGSYTYRWPLLGGPTLVGNGGTASTGAGGSNLFSAGGTNVSGGAASTTGGVGGAGGFSYGLPAGGGGAGGGITSGNVANNGGTGGGNWAHPSTYVTTTGGVVDGTLPGAGPGPTGLGTMAVAGQAGAGGAASITTAAQAGADGVGYGSSGGGGGASLNGNNSGRGGNGGPAYARIEWLYG